MKWATHIRITNEVMGRLGMHLSNEEYNQLKEGVIFPDKSRQFPHHNPHHYGKDAEISNFLLTSRSQFLQGDLYSAYFNLGIALHYIQDSFTSYPSFLPKHDEWEQWIENSYYVHDLEDKIQQSVRNPSQRQWCLALAQSLSGDVQGRDDTLRLATLNGHRKDEHSIASPAADFNLALRASYFVTKSVLGPKNCPPLETQLAQLLESYEEQMRRAEVDSSNLLIRLVNDRDGLVSKVIQSKGVVVKLKNWITGMKIGSIEKRIAAHKRDYFLRSHLGQVVSRYDAEARRLTGGHAGWYSFQILPIDPSIVPMELLEAHTASQALSMDTPAFESLLNERAIPRFQMCGSVMVRRSDLAAFGL